MYVLEYLEAGLVTNGNRSSVNSDDRHFPRSPVKQGPTALATDSLNHQHVTTGLPPHELGGDWHGD